MRPIMNSLATMTILLAMNAGPVSAQENKPQAAPAPPLAEEYLASGKFDDGIKALTAHLEKNPKDDQARFGLGVLQFVQGVEHLGRNLNSYGLGGKSRNLLDMMPIFRLPVPQNAESKVLTYEAARQVLQTWLDELKAADATLAQVSDPQVKLPLHVGRIRFHWTSDPSESKSIYEVMESIGMNSGPEGQDPQAEPVIVFDRGDVCWLRGYCNLLSFLMEFTLAHDGQELFDATAHLFFDKVETPHVFLTERDPLMQGAPIQEAASFVDLIAFIHLIRMPVKEPERMTAALQHLEQTLSHSRDMWKFIQAETDDDHEWIPNARQTGELGIPVSDEMIATWLEFLDEAEEVLQGKRLVPLWRGAKARGFNLRRAFTEPRPFDLVLWIQGTAATPYIEDGPMTRPDVWRRLMAAFRGGGGLFFFTVWFN